MPTAHAGVGLYEIDEDLTMTKVANHTSVYANRMIHHWSDQIIIGPYVIDKDRNIRTVQSLLEVRIGAVAEHTSTVVHSAVRQRELTYWALPASLTPQSAPVG